MTQDTLALTPDSDRIELAPLDRPTRNRLWNLVPMAISLALLGAVAWQLRSINLAELWAMVPRSPLFWLVFPFFYLAGPISEWIIFRRLWQIPLSGFGALLRKQVANELLLGYLGEAYFYSWARKRTAMVAAPFGAVKDVTILSAVAGNVMTLLLLIGVWPMIGSTILQEGSRPLLWSLAVVLLISFAAMVFRKSIFSLPRNELVFIFAMHIARIVASLALSALLWHLTLPSVAVVWWMFLATVRMLISRLPFIPNKDVVFAGLAVFLFGQDIAIGTLMAMMAGLLLITHMCVAAVLGVADLVKPEVTE
ncbi:hypothetical protein EB810_00630 [Altererythrobacter sp. FM1]|uniref:hypothetical protein n=1 Tax=Tsuneonella flava TaxID=2055955 RepID=UPI000C802EC4|nr:hypothetical protein [Tsuneonella flava]ROT96506.1 hypothetical protein EB810_00630 [Altererythrobacter sp. FM1]